MKTEEEVLNHLDKKYPYLKSVCFQFEENGEISYQTNALNEDKVDIAEIQNEVDLLLNRKSYTAKFVYYITDIHASNSEEARKISLKLNDFNKGVFLEAYEKL